MNKKSSLKVAKKSSARRITLRATNIRATQSIGNGFFRHVYTNVTIAPFQIRQINLVAPGIRRVVSAGWSVSLLQNAYATDSYPAQTNVWTLFISNPTPFVRTVTPYLITKLPF